jgi:hypothetical protein
MANGKSKALARLANEVFGDRRFSDVKTGIGIVATRWSFERPMILMIFKMVRSGVGSRNTVQLSSAVWRH